MKAFHFLYVCVITISLSISGCQTSEENKKSLKGERISVLKHRSQLVVDKTQARTKVTLPPQKLNSQWTQQHIAPTDHLALSQDLVSSQTTSIGAGAADGMRLTSNPIIANGVLYSLDGEGVVRAQDAASIDNILWTFTVGQDDVKSDFFGIGIGFGTEEKSFLGGNITFGQNTIFISTERAKVIALNAKNGQKKWARTVKLPIKTPSTYFKGKLFLVTSANTLFTLDADTGDTLWTHSGLKETTSLFGAPAPVAGKDELGEIVVVPFSSGEIYALDVSSGKQLWGTLLSGANSQFTSILSLSDIDATPVISNGMVYAVSHEGEFSAIGLRSGKTLWRQDIANTKTPWVADNFIYSLTNNNELVCLDTSNGAIKWVRKLRNNEKPSIIPLINNKDGDKISWNGPILAGNKLIIVGSHGKIALVNPYNGAITQVFDIEENSFMSPIIANKTMYILSNGGDLVTLK